MDLTEGTFQEKKVRAKKMMLWFGIASLIMSFAGWTSAYVVSSTREDWLKDFQLPDPFIISTLLILLSSLTFILAKKAVKKDPSYIDSLKKLQSSSSQEVQQSVNKLIRDLGN